MAASISAPLLNTVLFMSTLFLLYGNTDFIRGFGDSVLAIFMVLAGVNAAVELFVGFVAGTAVSRSLMHFFPGSNPTPKKG